MDFTQDLTLDHISTCHSSVRVKLEEPDSIHYSANYGIFIWIEEELDRVCDIEIQILGNQSSAHLKITFLTALSKPREKRILWDSYHSLKYPESGLVIRDEKQGEYLFDWRADSPYTNLVDAYAHIISLGYQVDILRTDFGCFDASVYSTLLIIDPEASFTADEIEAIRYHLAESELSLLIFADWDSMSDLKEAKGMLDSGNVMV